MCNVHIKEMSITMEQLSKIREDFHDFMSVNGFDRPVTPAAGKKYNGSHIETLWQCYLSATMNERWNWINGMEPDKL